jgi:protease-4
MRSFFKTFFASLLALIVFFLLCILFLVSIVSGLTSKEKQRVGSQSVLVLNLSQHYKEQKQENPLSIINSDDEKDVPGLYDVIRLLHKAKTDKKISGVYVLANPSPNGFEASDEIRNAILDFKQSGKFVIAFADVITQKSYYIANASDKIYLSPSGYLEWSGMSVEYAFLKGTLEKLDIEPQIFYAGKFKSATEPLRTDKMTPENRLQTTEWLNDLYNDLLMKTAASRKIDTATLRQLANSGKIQNAKDAVGNKLVDGLKYDDEIKDEIKTKLNIGKYDRINFVTINAYAALGNFKKLNGEKIALIYAEGDIVDGNVPQGAIAGDNYRSLIRKARLDKTIKAIVFRVNSGGGSVLASETIWRELSLAKKEKPVVVSFGDVAASGGYYISCSADSIFASPVTITGSIGVFGIVPNMQGFFKNKLGITFDGVKTGPYADAATIVKPMTDDEKKIIQNDIERIYAQFKHRVADGRKKDTAAVEEIAQGRVWTGQKAITFGLIDRFGGIDDAIECAARMAKLKEYYVAEYPEVKNIFDQVFGQAMPLNFNNKIKNEIGEDNFKLFEQLKKIKQMTNTVQARLPFEFFIK